MLDLSNNKRLSLINDLPNNKDIVINNKFKFTLFDSFSYNDSLVFINSSDSSIDDLLSTPTFIKFNNSIFKVISQSKESFLNTNSSISFINKITVANSSDLLRQISFFHQRLFSNFDSSDIWNLDISISKFLIPRLEYLNSINQSWFSKSSNSFVPSSSIINPILEGLYLYINKDLSSWSPSDSSSFNTSLSLLSSHFSDLWF